LECVELLLKCKGVNIFAEDRYENQPIHYAIKKYYHEIVMLFLNDPRYTAELKKVVLEWTKDNGYDEMIYIFESSLDASADLKLLKL
jgi:hypothetical protein